MCVGVGIGCVRGGGGGVCVVWIRNKINVNYKV